VCEGKCATVSGLTDGVDMERKRYISAPDESHSDSESTSLLSRHEPSPAVQLLPRPRSSAALDDFIDSSTRTSAADADVEELVSSVTGSAASVCAVTYFLLTASVFGSRPSDHYFRSVCSSVCLFVCLFVQSFSRPSSIRFRSN